MKFIIAAALLLFTIGCAEMHKKWQANTCNYDGAYAEGVNDAKDSKNMNPTRLTSQCPDNTRADVQRGYREGYTSQSNSLGNLISNAKELFGTKKSCQAKENDVHTDFCSGNDEQTCKLHSGVCAWK